MGVHVSSDPCHWPMRALVTSACSPIGPHYQTKPHNVLSGCNDERVQASTDAQSPSVTLLLLQAIGGCSHITSAKVRGSLTPPDYPLRQLSSAFARRPFCTTIFDVDFFAGDINLYGSNLHVTWL